MPKLNVTLIDVGWGDSIFIDSVDSQGEHHYALVDSNDKTYNPGIFYLKKELEKQGKRIPDDKPIFDWIMLSHAHEDHGNGLKKIMQQYGTQDFFYPKPHTWGGLKHLLRYVQRYHVNVKHHQSVDNTKIINRLGDVDLEILWPLYGMVPFQNENNNSIVLKMTLDDVAFIITGDAEEEVWDHISGDIPQRTRFFKVPHHGSKNGSLHQGNPTWYQNFLQQSKLGISCHLVPHDHPHQDVIDLFENNQVEYFRTDEHYHVTYSTEGDINEDVEVKYSRI
jgi:competence protein ComEC